MFRGHFTVRMDDRARVRLPGAFSEVLLAHFDEQLYLTSVDGASLRVYPLEAWLAIEEKLHKLPSMHAGRNKLLTRFNYFGSEANLDRSGRLLVPALIRQRAGLEDEVAVVGFVDHIQLWNAAALSQQLENEPLTSDDADMLAELGI